MPYPFKPLLGVFFLYLSDKSASIYFLSFFLGSDFYNDGVTSAYTPIVVLLFSFGVAWDIMLAFGFSSGLKGVYLLTKACIPTYPTGIFCFAVFEDFFARMSYYFETALLGCFSIAFIFRINNY